MRNELRLRLRRILVWLCRLAAGAVFVVSGWAKAVDPAGFIIKVGEYLSAWDLQVPHEAIVAGCIALSALEFATGIILASGCLKRVSAIIASAMMAAMLPLTLYIAIANPVADCGCFGDLFKISNWATFLKNIGISAVLGYLLWRNRTVPGIYPAPVQWLVATVSLAFPLALSMMGYHVQPVADFRDYPLGSQIFRSASDTDNVDELFVYERDGRRQAFALDSLPDESWTFVEATATSESGADIAVRDDDGDDVSADIVNPEAPQLWLIVPDPGVQFLSRSHQVNNLYSHLSELGIDFTTIVGSRGAAYDYWLDLTRPRFPVYSAENTALEQLVRGSAGLVYTRGGTIVWKRTLKSLPDDLLEQMPPEDTEEQSMPNVLDNVTAVDDGRISLASMAMFAAILLVLYLLGLSPKAVKMITAVKRTKK